MLVCDLVQPNSASIGRMNTEVNPKPPNPMAIMIVAASTTTVPREQGLAATNRAVRGSAINSCTLMCISARISASYGRLVRAGCLLCRGWASGGPSFDHINTHPDDVAGALSVGDAAVDDPRKAH